MRTNLILAMVVLSAFMMIARPASADLLTGDVFSTSIIAQFSDNGTTGNVYVSPMKVNNLTSGETMAAFCGDFRTNTSSAFSTTGQEYGSFGLKSSDLTIYTDLQKTAIDSLFGNVYDSAFNLDGTIIDQAVAVAMQICLWEILSESSGTLDISTGSFKLVSSIDHSVLDLVNSWSSALMGSTSWESLGYDYTHYAIDVYVADGGMTASQTLINVNPNSPVTPEPATWAIIGLGMVGLTIPLVRRMRRQPLLQRV